LLNNGIVNIDGLINLHFDESGKLTFEDGFTQAEISLFDVTNEWHMLTIQWDGLNKEIWLDGEQLFSEQSAISPQLSNGQIVLGAGQGLSYRGVVDDLFIFNRALTRQDIQQLYHQPTQESEGVTNGVRGKFLFNGNLNDSSDFATHLLQLGSSNASNCPGDYSEDRYGNSGSAYCGADSLKADSHNLPTGTQPAAISGWIKLEPGYNGSTLICWPYIGLSSCDSEIAIEENRYLRGIGGSWSDLQYSVTPDEWHFVVSQQDGTTQQLWFDNQLVYSQSASTNVAAGGSLRLAAGNHSSSATIDDITVFDHVLTAADIRTLYEPKAEISLSASGRVTEDNPVVRYTATTTVVNNYRDTTVVLNSGDRIVIPLGEMRGYIDKNLGELEDPYLDQSEVSDYIRVVSGLSSDAYIINAEPVNTTIEDTITPVQLHLIHDPSQLATSNTIRYRVELAQPSTQGEVVVSLQNGEIITLPVNATSAGLDITLAANDPYFVNGLLVNQITGVTGGNLEQIDFSQSAPVIVLNEQTITDAVDYYPFNSDLTNQGSSGVNWEISQSPGFVIEAGGNGYLNGQAVVMTSVEDQFSISFKVKASAFGSEGDHYSDGRMILKQRDNSNFGVSLLGDRIALGIGDQQLFSQTAVALNEWIHVVVVKQGTDALLIVNGRLEGILRGVAFGFNGALPLLIGDERYPDESITAMDELYLFSHPLSLDNIYELSLISSNIDGPWQPNL
ncbi:MAG: hypothetical protein HQL48_08225, partial [Gammaproteobacteria bacterium]|nr:hypothetical protein [Gammaproteobacteria bacterium]